VFFFFFWGKYKNSEHRVNYFGILGLYIKKRDNYNKGIVY